MVAHAESPVTRASEPWLLRLYPAQWRERYGVEMADLLAARAPSARDRLDILRGAIDARIHPQVTGSPVPRTATARDRVLALASVSAGALFSTWAGIIVTLSPRWGEMRSVDNDLIALSYGAGFLGALIGMAVLLGVAFRHVEDLGSIGVIGAVIAATGFLLFTGDSGAWAVVLLCIGTLVMSVGLARAVGWQVSLLLVAATLFVAAAMFGFVGGNGQELLWLWMLVVFGPSWILLGIKLRNGIHPAGMTPAVA